VRLERNIVVGQFADRLAHRLVLATTAAGPCAGAGAALLRSAAAAAHSAAATTTEQHDPIAANLGGVFIIAVFVLPLARLQAPLDVDLLALGQVFRQRLGRLAPQDDAVPLGFFLLLTSVVARLRVATGAPPGV
jgi:hypothetical protein